MKSPLGNRKKTFPSLFDHSIKIRAGTVPNYLIPKSSIQRLSVESTITFCNGMEKKLETGSKKIFSPSSLKIEKLSITSIPIPPATQESHVIKEKEDTLLAYLSVHILVAQ